LDLYSSNSFTKREILQAIDSSFSSNADIPADYTMPKHIIRFAYLISQNKTF